MHCTTKREIAAHALLHATCHECDNLMEDEHERARAGAGEGRTKEIANLPSKSVMLERARDGGGGRDLDFFACGQVLTLSLCVVVQGLAKRWSLGCVNSPSLVARGVRRRYLRNLGPNF